MWLMPWWAWFLAGILFASWITSIQLGKQRDQRRALRQIAPVLEANMLLCSELLIRRHSLKLSEKEWLAQSKDGFRDIALAIQQLEASYGKRLAPHVRARIESLRAPCQIFGHVGERPSMYDPEKSLERGLIWCARSIGRHREFRKLETARSKAFLKTK